MTKYTLGALFFILLVIAVIMIILAHGAPPYSVELSVSRWVQSIDIPGFSGFMIVLTRLGLRPAVVIIVVAAAVVLFLLRLRLAAFFVLLTATGDALVILLKDIVARPRPTSDHIKGLGTLSRRYGVPVIANSETLAAIRGIIGEVGGRSMPAGTTSSVGDLDVTTFPISHDAASPVGLFIEYGGNSACFLTDLGFVGNEAIEPFQLADLVVLEANHDVVQLVNGPYPRFLKARIKGEKGHLSNEQAGELIVKAAGSKPKKVWLAHLSAINNSPSLANNTVQNQLRSAKVTTVSVETTRRDTPSLFWRASSSGWQPSLI